MDFYNGTKQNTTLFYLGKIQNHIFSPLCFSKLQSWQPFFFLVTKCTWMNWIVPARLTSCTWRVRSTRRRRHLLASRVARRTRHNSLAVVVISVRCVTLRAPAKMRMMLMFVEPNIRRYGSAEFSWCTVCISDWTVNAKLSEQNTDDYRNVFWLPPWLDG